jgi:D-glycero-D-manno-heptose 1,7-bisphosphate phosphatase
MDEQPLRYFLLDRDGVIHRRSSHGHPECWDKFEFLPRALEALRLLAENHYAGIILSHQPRQCEAAASANELDTITRRLLLEVALAGGHIAHVYYCRHRIEDPACDCYYPNAGLIARAKAEYGFPVEETYFVSEGELDLQAASDAGCPCIRIQRDAFLQEQGFKEEPYKVASNLYEAAEQIVASAPAFEQVYATVHA